MAWDSGHQLQQGQYSIQSLLSSKGGQGITYLAKKDTSGQTVVIKTIKDEYLKSLTKTQAKKYKEDFEKEAQTLKQCRHPNIVKFEDFFVEGSQPCLVMEYIEGKNLLDIIQEQGILSEKEALIYIKQIGNALTLIHDKGSVHRDVSPNNIMVRSNSQEAVLIDFGIARKYISKQNITSHTKDGYAPIEQYSEDFKEYEQGPYTDVYALAATLYYLLTGKEPSASWTRNLSGEDNLLAPQELNSNISDHINKVILEGMSIEAKDRPNSIQEWFQKLFQKQVILKKIHFDVVILDVRGSERERTQHHAQLLEQVINEELPIIIEMVKVPTGEFCMGTEDSERVKNTAQESKLNERPRHSVRVNSFFISRFPITQKIWKIIANLPRVQLDLNPSCSFFQDNDNNPVEQVSWYQAIEFCERLSRLTEFDYRLPSEAEWEYACRAGIDKKPFHFGDTITTNVANYDGTESYNYEPRGEFYGKTKPVGSFGLANAFGLSDMHGNVWEWCADPKHDNYQDAPSDSRVWEIEEETANNSNISRVLRGGSWKTKARDCRAATRRFVRPTRSDSTYGFRLALSNNFISEL